MNAKEILLKVKALFDSPTSPTLPVDTTAPDDVTGTDMVMFSWPIDGGDPVFVDCSDDGIADIDLGDDVYTDITMAAPYPDGTYKVTGTDFSFTVAGGTVSAINDADGTGAGSAIEQQTATQPDQDMKKTAPAVATTSPLEPKKPTVEERLAVIESEISKIKTPAAPANMATQAEMKAASKKIDKQDLIIKGLFELVEKMVELPSAAPVTLTGAKKEQFDRVKQKEIALERIAEGIKKMKQK